MDSEDATFMRDAIALSLEALKNGTGAPYGAVITKDGAVVGRGKNAVLEKNDPTEHAEMAAIREACKTLETGDLSGCILYTSCEPCPMCMSACYWAKINKLYFGNTKEDAARYGMRSGAIYEQLALPKEKRKIEMLPLLHSEALEVFEEMGRTIGTVRY